MAELIGLTKKQEDFANAWYSTGCKSDAYRHAYNAGTMDSKTISRKAMEVANIPKVRARYEALQAESLKRHKRSVTSLDAMFQDAFEVAKSVQNPSAMVAAVSGLAKLHGLNAPDKVNNTVSFLESDYLNEVQKNLK